MLGPSEIPGLALVVDDDHAVAALLAAFLLRLGLTVTVAHSLEEGEQRLADGGWALMVTDLNLGGGSGAEGLELLDRARRDCPGARTILMSGSAGPEILSEASRRGADLFLPKPITFADLSSSVRSLLGTSPLLQS